MSHQGTVGKPLLGTLHIVGDDGDELPSGESGTIYFEGGGQFEYHNDAEKTAVVDATPRAGRRSATWATSTTTASSTSPTARPS